MSDVRHVYHLYVVRTPRRDALQQALQAAGIRTAIHYPMLVHLQPAYIDLGYRPGDFPCAEQAAREVLSLPMYPELSDTQIAQMARAIGERWRSAPSMAVEVHPGQVGRDLQ